VPRRRQLLHVVDRLVEMGESRRSPLHHSAARATFATFQDQPGPPTFFPPAPRSRRRALAGLATLILVVGLVGVVSGKATFLGGRVAQSQANLVSNIIPVSDRIPGANGGAGSASIAGRFGHGAKLTPARPGESAAALAGGPAGPALQPHEVFGFAPYWTLAQSGGFDLKGLTTVAYFSVGINADGSIDTSDSDAGWQGYNSQNFIDLIDQAHAAGDRVVLSVTDFSQPSLDQLTSDPSAPSLLAQNLVSLVEGKSLDGVNLDFEGDGSGDQAGLTNLVTVVSAAMHAANPDYQVTMDTYASSAGDPSGFYNIPALSHVVDGFFVMSYQLNLKASSDAVSPLTSVMFSNQEAAQQYAQVVPANKVILGLALFGYDWPTTDGTLGAQPEGAPTIVTYSQEADSGNPIYWDADTDTAWTSYQVGQQWHEAFFEDPTSLYMGAQLAQQNGLAGVGAWALGMDGSHDAAIVSALDGNAPAHKDALAGPGSTSASPLQGPTGGGSSPGSQSGGSTPGGATPGGATPGGPASATTTTSPAPTTTTTTAPLLYEGSWQGDSVELDVVNSLDPIGLTLIGTLSGFATNDPAFGCLVAEPTLQVYALSTDPDRDYVVTQTPGDCVNGTFSFANAGLPPPTTTTTAPPG
jgi:GH18 family chitinase